MLDILDETLEEDKQIRAENESEYICLDFIQSSATKCERVFRRNDTTVTK